MYHRRVNVLFAYVDTGLFKRAFRQSGHVSTVTTDV